MAKVVLFSLLGRPLAREAALLFAAEKQATSENLDAFLKQQFGQDARDLANIRNAIGHCVRPSQPHLSDLFASGDGEVRKRLAELVEVLLEKIR